MIWVDGRVVADSALSVSVLDRSFEHGLGLFETLRTWGGRPLLLDRHLNRLRRSADELGIPLNDSTLPDAEAIAQLLEAGEVEGDVLLRMTLSGGLSATTGSTLWVRSTPLPPPLSVNERGATLDLDSWRIDKTDPLLGHKSLNYWRRRIAQETARARGFDECVGMDQDLRFWEGSRTNLFAVLDGEILTPTLAGPIVPGIMRGLMIELASSLPLPVKEVNGLELEQIQAASELFLTNSVRGLIPVFQARGWSWEQPGPVVTELNRLWTEWRMEEEHRPNANGG